MNQSQQNVRVLMCTQCGAPIQTSQQGGSYTCEYCGAALQVGAQRSGPISFQSAQDQLGLDPEQMEAARLKSLKKQADHYDASNPYSYYEAPDDLEYIAATDELDDSFLPMALQAFKMATDRCHASSCALPDQRRVYWLAKKLKNS